MNQPCRAVTVRLVGVNDVVFAPRQRLGGGALVRARELQEDMQVAVTDTARQVIAPDRVDVVAQRTQHFDRPYLRAGRSRVHVGRRIGKGQDAERRVVHGRSVCARRIHAFT